MMNSGIITSAPEDMNRRGGRGVWLTLLSLALAVTGGCFSAERAAQVELDAAKKSQFAGKPAVDFTLPDQDGDLVSLRDTRGKWVVLYFYPADGTPGCTCQAEEFTQTHAQYQRLDADVYGISPDTVASHRAFADEFHIAVTLLADPEHKVLEAYGAWVFTPLGSRVIRSTVLIDPAGRVAYHWPEVIPQGHAERVRAKLEELKRTWSPTEP